MNSELEKEVIDNKLTINDKKLVQKRVSIVFVNEADKQGKLSFLMDVSFFCEVKSVLRVIDEELNTVVNDSVTFFVEAIYRVICNTKVHIYLNHIGKDGINNVNENIDYLTAVEIINDIKVSVMVEIEMNYYPMIYMVDAIEVGPDEEKANFINTNKED